MARSGRLITMARVTIYIPDDLLREVNTSYVEGKIDGPYAGNMSGLCQAGLRALLGGEGRPERSERGRIETLRAVRAAQAALGDVERGLTQARPVKRHTKRVR